MQKFFLLTLLCLPLWLVAQESPRTRIDLGLGYTQFKTLDLQHSPLIYRANAAQVSARLERYRPQSRWQIGLSLAAGGQQAQRFGQRRAFVYDRYDLTGQRDSTLYVLNPGFSFARASLHTACFWTLSVAKLPLQLGFRVEDVFQYAGLGAGTWFFNQLTLAPALRTETEWGPGTLEAEISASLLAYTLGLPYALDPSTPDYPGIWSYVSSGSHVNTPARFRQGQLQLYYRLPLGTHEIGLGYRFDWIQHQPADFQPLSAYGHTLQFTYIL